MLNTTGFLITRLAQKLQISNQCNQYNQLEGTARYAGLLLAPAEGFDIQPRPLWPSAKAYMAFGQ